MKESESSLEEETSLGDLNDEECDRIIFNALVEAYGLKGESGESKAIH